MINIGDKVRIVVDGEMITGDVTDARVLAGQEYFIVNGGHYLERELTKVPDRLTAIEKQELVMNDIQPRTVLEPKEVYTLPADDVVIATDEQRHTFDEAPDDDSQFVMMEPEVQEETPSVEETSEHGDVNEDEAVSVDTPDADEEWDTLKAIEGALEKMEEGRTQMNEGAKTFDEGMDILDKVKITLGREKEIQQQEDTTEEE